MPEFNINQITDKLNAEFASGDARKLVFWYDDNAEFEDDIDDIASGLVNAKLYRLQRDNQFYTKYFLECVDRKTNYLIYAPFPKPLVQDNHLEDTLLYSKQFYADRISMMLSELGIDQMYRPIVEKYRKFFIGKDGTSKASLQRTQQFYDLEIENYNESTIEIGIMSVLCKTHTASFDEVLRVVLTDDGFKNNKFLAGFDKYSLLPAFWRLCEEQFGYADGQPTLEKFMVTMFVTYTQRCLHGDLPQAWHSFVSYKSGNIIAFMDNLMNSILYCKRYDEISGFIAAGLKAENTLGKYVPEKLVDCDTFMVVDRLILRWLSDRLLNEDTGAKLGDLDIPSVCELRCKKHFRAQFLDQYQMLADAFYLISAANYSCPGNLKEIFNRYLEKDYQFDSYYREFYYRYDRLAEPEKYEKLRDLVENIYTNEYLSVQLPKWNVAFVSNDTMKNVPLQREFFNQVISEVKEKVVVIISDALRYEVGRSLCKKLQEDANCTPQLDAMLSVLPSFTPLGMAALLPHKILEMTDDYKVLVDGTACDTLKQREAILQCYVPNSRCVRYDDIKTMNKEQLREIFTGKEVVYVYHNQIDARGEGLNTDNEVFTACQEAIEEIYGFIKKLSGNANTYHFIVTADHGFIYKRNRLTESDKISNSATNKALLDRRFIISQNSVEDDGVASVPMGRMVDNGDNKVISFPISSNVFKAGGGANYVHGGSSPQEMIVPVIDVRTERYHTDTKPAQIALVSVVQKITNLIVSLDFIQSEPVSDIVTAVSYKIFFVSEDNEKISSECIYLADNKDPDPRKRIFRQRFTFKNKRYDNSKKYYLVAYDEKNLETFRHSVVMDVAFANDFGFRV